MNSLQHKHFDSNFVGCSMDIKGCLFEADLSKVGLLHVNKNGLHSEKHLSTQLINLLVPDLDIVIHFKVYYPELIISLRFEKNRRFCLVDESFYFDKKVLPVCYDEYLDSKFANLEDVE